MKREADFNSTFRSWLKANPMPSAAFELKQTTTDSLPFSSVKDHQLWALLAVKNNQLLFKIPDAGYQNPFDFFYFNQAKAYVVIKYPDFFCVIDIDDWIKENASSVRRSLTSERAKAIAKETVLLLRQSQ